MAASKLLCTLFFTGTFRDLSLWTCIPRGLLEWVIRILENAIDFTDAEQEHQVNCAD